MTDPATVTEIEHALDAERVGPSMWGEIYRSRRSRTYLRVIPNGVRGLTARRRHELESWPALPPAPGLAPAVRAGQRPVRQDLWFDCVEYAVDGEPLTGVLADGRAADRAAAATRVLRAVPAWWAALDDGILPMAGDVVLVDGEPWLLRTPRWGVPGPAELLAEPERALHLAPELVRGVATTPDRSADLFAVGSALLGCAYATTAGHGAAVLHRMAGGTALDPAHRVGRLPAWTAAVPAIGHGMAQLATLVSADPAERVGAGLDRVADALAAGAEALDPVTSVRRMRLEQDDEAALLLARDALLDEDSYELSLLAAELAAERLRRPLTALTFLEEAVRREPSRPEAYAAQFRLVARLHGPIIAMLARLDGSFAERLDRIMAEALAHADPAERDGWLPAMADYLVARGQDREATRLLHAALVEDGVVRWWKFAHMLAYGRAFLSAGRCAQARSVAGQVRAGLERVRRNRTVSEPDIGRYGLELRALEEELVRQCGTGP